MKTAQLFEFSEDRVFHVMGKGWYLELDDRTYIGPYSSRNAAEVHFREPAGSSLRFQSDRCFHISGSGWFVHTREGEEGPFAYKRAALDFIDQLVKTSGNKRESVWDPQIR